MKNTSNSDPFIKKIKQHLDTEDLDKNTRQQLINARHLALESTQQADSFRWLQPGLVMAFVLVIAISMVLFYPSQQPQLQLETVDAFDIITSNDELEMYENLEFYLWLDEQTLEKV